jgi:4-amino-4-deoxy-L-arabinose transferase-like glycosyltransferase
MSVPSSRVKTMSEAPRTLNTKLPAAARAPAAFAALPLSAGLRVFALVFVLGLLPVAAAIAFWPIYPVDETRYLSVAWEMWHGGDFLVPHLNGREYSHKPPLLFWLVNLGWLTFGVNAWWPRVIGAAFAIASALLVMHIARTLWPSRRSVSHAAPLMLQASCLWMAFAPAILFDVLLAFFVLLAMTGILQATKGRRGGWILCGVGLGLGVLAKGPVVLLHVAPVAIVAPLWVDGRQSRWWRWYGGFFVAVLLGAAIALTWALPAAFRGSHEYANAIFWSQSAGRLVNSSAPHARPLWWYLPWLPLLLSPWILWKPVWSGLRQLRLEEPDWGTRFCLAWAASVLTLFSLVSGKQIHYLLPLVPCLVLLVARALATVSPAVAVHGSASRIRVGPGSAITKLAFASTAAAAFIIAAAMYTLARSGQDLEPVARHLKQLDAQGVPLAHVGRYYGEYHFLGRLERPFAVLSAPNLREWLDGHPEGRLVVHFRQAGKVPLQAEFSHPYRGHNVAIISAPIALSLLSPEGRLSDIDF